MNQVLEGVAVAAASMAAGGGAWLRHLLKAGQTWRPDEPLPEVPPDAPILHWTEGKP